METSSAPAIVVTLLGHRQPRLLAQLCQPQIGAIPGHIRVVPLNPGDLLSIGPPGWLHIEIGAYRQFLRPELASGINDCQVVLTFITMDKGQPAAIG